jgi:hypothetical protein
MTALKSGGSSGTMMVMLLVSAPGAVETRVAETCPAPRLAGVEVLGFPQLTKLTCWILGMLVWVRILKSVFLDIVSSNYFFIDQGGSTSNPIDRHLSIHQHASRSFASLQGNLFRF